MTIEIQDFKTLQDPLKKAQFTVRIVEWEILIRYVTLFVKDNKKWINLPSRREENGRFLEIFSFESKEKTDRLKASIKEALERLMLL